MEQPPHRFRSQSDTMERTNRAKLTNPVQDLFRRASSVNMEKYGGRTTNATSTDGTEAFSTPRNRYEPGASPEELDQVIRRSVSGYSTGSSAGLGDFTLIHWDGVEGSENGSSNSCRLPHSKDLNPSSPPSVLVSANYPFWVNNLHGSHAEFEF